LFAHRNSDFSATVPFSGYEKTNKQAYLLKAAIMSKQEVINMLRFNFRLGKGKGADKKSILPKDLHPNLLMEFDQAILRKLSEE